MNTQKYKFKDICLLFDGPHATPKSSDEGPIFLGIKSISEDGSIISDNIRHIAWDDYPKWTKRVVPQEGDIVFSYEGTLHLYYLIPKGFIGCLGRRMALLRIVSDKVNYQYLYYYLRSETWYKYISSRIISGSTADFINSIDNLIKNNNRRIAILEDIAQRLYREWFVHFRFPGNEDVEMVESESGLIPEGWRFYKTQELILSFLGGDWGTENQTEKENIPVKIIRGTDFRDIEFGKAQLPCRFISEPSIEKRKIEKGDIIVENSINSKSRCSGTPLYEHAQIILPQNEEEVFMLGRRLLPFLNRNLARKNKNLRQTLDLLLHLLISGDLDASGLDISINKV